MYLPRVPISGSTAIANITGAVGSSITITTAAPHNLISGQRVRITGVTGDLAANGDFTIAVVPPVAPATQSTSFTLNTCVTTPNCSTSNSAAYTGGGNYLPFITSNPEEAEGE